MDDDSRVDRTIVKDGNPYCARHDRLMVKANFQMFDDEDMFICPTTGCHNHYHQTRLFDPLGREDG